MNRPISQQCVRFCSSDKEDYWRNDRGMTRTRRALRRVAMLWGGNVQLTMSKRPRVQSTSKHRDADAVVFPDFRCHHGSNKCHEEGWLDGAGTEQAATIIFTRTPHKFCHSSRSASGHDAPIQSRAARSSKIKTPLNAFSSSCERKSAQYRSGSRSHQLCHRHKRQEVIGLQVARAAMFLVMTR